MSARVPQRARVSVHTLPLWRIRLARALSRGLLVGACALVAVVSARLRSQPASAAAQRPPGTSTPAPDPAAAGFAVQFARAYLAYDARDPESRAHARARFGGSALAPEAGFTPPLSGSRRVLSAAVVAERAPRAMVHVYTVAVETLPGETVYLAVPVLVQRGGQLALASYPAFVGGPRIAAASPTLLSGAEVDQPALEQAVERALRNYLAPAPSQLAADLAPSAHLTTPSIHLHLEAVSRLLRGVAGPVVPAHTDGARVDAQAAQLEAHGSVRTVVAVVEAGAHGARYTLAYEVEVELLGGRWEVLSIETDAQAE